MRSQPSPIVALNRAIAVAQRDGPSADYEAIESIAASRASRRVSVLPCCPRRAGARAAETMRTRANTSRRRSLRRATLKSAAFIKAVTRPARASWRNEEGMMGAKRFSISALPIAGAACSAPSSNAMPRGVSYHAARVAPDKRGSTKFFPDTYGDPTPDGTRRSMCFTSFLPVRGSVESRPGSRSRSTPLCAELALTRGHLRATRSAARPMRRSDAARRNRSAR